MTVEGESSLPRVPGLGPARPARNLQWLVGSLALGQPWPSLGLSEAVQVPEAAGHGPARLAKPQEHPTRKRTYFDHPDSVFDVLGLVGITTTSRIRSEPVLRYQFVAQAGRSCKRRSSIYENADIRHQK